MALLKLNGVHAVGRYTHALVDDDRMAELSQYAWKAKPNGNGTHVYAVRNTMAADGRCITIRLHRVVLGYDGPLEVDHINRDTMDNRAVNLRAVTRSVNARNSIFGGPFSRWPRVLPRPKLPRPQPVGRCMRCACEFVLVKPRQSFCAESCRKAAKRARQAAAGCLPPSQGRPGGFLGPPPGVGSADSSGRVLSLVNGGCEW